MSHESGEHFPKRVRLRKRAEYLEVQRNGKKAESRGFIGLFVPGKTPDTRLGVVVTKRVGNAPTRNRAKRLVREAFRRSRIELPRRIDLVVIAKRGAAGMGSAEVFEDLAHLGRKLGRLAGPVR